MTSPSYQPALIFNQDIGAADVCFSLTSVLKLQLQTDVRPWFTSTSSTSPQKNGIHKCIAWSIAMFRKTQKDIILWDWEIPPGPQDSNQSKNPSDLGCFFGGSLVTRDRWLLGDAVTCLSFCGIFSREIPENPNLNHPFSTVYWEKPSQAYLRRRRCVPSLCIGDVMALHQAGISGRKRGVSDVTWKKRLANWWDMWLKWYRMSLSYCKSFLPRFEVCDFCFVCFGTVCFVEDGFFVREMTVAKYQFHGFKGSWNPSSRGRWSLANLLPKLNHDHSSRWGYFTLSSQFFHDSSAL